MRSVPKILLVCGVLSLASFAAMAQAQPTPCGPGKRQFAWMMIATGGGCPFSGTIETERVKTLADGTHVQTNEKNLIYRDSLGRIRYQSYSTLEIDNKMTEVLVFDQIIDSTTGYMYVLQQQTGIARRSKLRPQGMNSTGNAQPRNSSVKATGSAPDQNPQPGPVLEDLGTQQMEGLSVIGVRTTRTIRAGAEGNDAPIITISDIWTSPDLGVSLLHTASDPRSGDVSSRMTNVQRLEPDPALFQVPADYKIKDQ
jgi:hypothetical protein